MNLRDVQELGRHRPTKYPPVRLLAIEPYDAGRLELDNFEIGGQSEQARRKAA